MHACDNISKGMNGTVTYIMSGFHPATEFGGRGGGSTTSEWVYMYYVKFRRVFGRVY